jgi:hypothetical protein
MEVPGLFSLSFRANSEQRDLRDLIPGFRLTARVQLNMKTNQHRRSSAVRSVRFPSEASREEAAPFYEGDVVEYVASPSRRFIVAHCYARVVGGSRQWVVAEVNANTHPAADLRRVTPG